MVNVKSFKFEIKLHHRAMVIEGTATVLGDYDGPSKPEAMVRAALEEVGETGGVSVTLIPPPDPDVVKN